MRVSSWCMSTIMLFGSTARAELPCAQRVAAMSARLDTLGKAPPAVEFAIDALPTSATRRPIADTAPVLVVQPDFPLVFEGQNLGDDDAAAIKQVAARVAQEPRLYIAAQPTVAWERVRPLLAALPPSVALRLVVSSKPSRQASEREVAALITGLQRSAGTCGDVMNAFASSASHAQSHRWHHLKRDLVKAVTRCDCEGVAVEKLTGFVAKLGSDQLSYGWLPLEVRDFPAKATMSTVAGQLR